MDSVVLVVDGEHFSCSKSKLSEKSAYFNAMFYSGFVEKDKSEVNLKDVNKSSIKHLVAYVNNPKEYLSNITNTNNECNVLELCCLLETANMLQFTEVQEQCVDILSDELNINNSLNIWQVAEKTDANCLARQARAMSLWYFDSVIETNSFTSLPYDILHRYLSDDGLFSNLGELGVWTGIDTWISYKWSNRIDELPRLIKCLRFCMLANHELTTITLYESIRKFPHVLKAILMIFNKSLEFYEDQETCDRIKSNDPDNQDVVKLHKNLLKTKPRQLPYVPSVVAEDTLTSSYCVCYWSLENEELVPLVKLDKIESGVEGIAGFKVISHGPKLFVFGGETILRSRNWNTSIWEYDLILKKWIFFESLPQSCRHMMGCILEDELYIIGGFGRFRVKQTSVYRISLREKKWIKCAPLPVHLFSAPCCTYKGQVYVMGTHIYVYNKEMNTWSTLHISVPAHEGLNSAVAVDDSIIVTGDMTTNVYKINPTLPGASFEIVGQLKYPSNQSCVIYDYLYSFSEIMFSELVSFEVLNIKTGEHVFVWSGSSGQYRYVSRHHHGCCPLLMF